ncbi:MAG: hypothetical protein QG580_301 [Patescibacteria group bacterium]|jgi:hypothetical protein|nr:hypothetical protein [Patescibacteria group bacterium]
MSENIQKDGKLSPKFFFLSLGVLVSLVASVVSFLNLIFQALNKRFPDALNSTYTYGYSSWDYDAIRASLATLIIVFPVFLTLSYFWKKVGSVGLSRVDEIIKKWMVYLILFLSSVVVVVDLVTLVRYFVAGEITQRFLIKVGVTLLVALVSLVYYSSLIKNENKCKGKEIFFGSISLLMVLSAIVWSFTVIGSPKDQRAWRLDERRVQDLQSIQWQVINFWQQKERLPEELKDLSSPLSGFMVPVDPEFEKGLAYEYKKLEGLKFELCATFSAEMPQGWVEYGGGVMPMYGGKDVAVSSMPFPGNGGDSWMHEAGKTCFEREIDKEMFPPFENNR